MVNFRYTNEHFKIKSYTFTIYRFTFAMSSSGNLRHTFSSTNLKKDSLESECINFPFLINNKKHTFSSNMDKIMKIKNSSFASYGTLKICNEILKNEMSSHPTSMNHRITSILSQLNAKTFQNVLSELLSLGINSEEFISTFVDSTFKQAVLNPSISILYSFLLCNIASVIKRTKFGSRINELLEEKCIESFDVPNVDNKWYVNRLHGVATFIGNLVRDNLLNYSLFEQFVNSLLQESSPVSISLLITMISSGGKSLIKSNSIISDISDKVNSFNDKNLLESFNSMLETTHSSLYPISKLCKDDNKMNQSYLSLLTRSDSVPGRLSSFVGKIQMDELVYQYINNPSSSEFAKLLKDNNYSKNSVRTATDLVRAAALQSENSRATVAGLISDMIMYRFFNEDQGKIALYNIAYENNNDENIGKSLVYIFAVLLTDEIFTFDDFESIFSSMNKIYSSIIPYFFCIIDDMLGSWVDDMMESEFWCELKFINSKNVIEQLEILNAWHILDVFPEYDLAFSFYNQTKKVNGSYEFLLNSNEMSIDHAKLLKLVLEILISMDNSKAVKIIRQIENWLNFFSAEVLKSVKRYSEKGERLSKSIHF